MADRNLRSIGLAPALVALALVAPGAAGTLVPTPASAQTASATGCSGVTLTPSSRTVRRGGRVLLTGRACSSSGAASAAAGNVRIKLRKGRRWASVGSASADQSGAFEVCVPVRVSSRAKIAQLQASSQSGVSGITRLRVSNKGSSRCEADGGSGDAQAAPPPSSPGGYRPPPPDGPANPACPLASPESNLGFTLPEACTVVASDTASNPNPIPFWGGIACHTASRHQQIGAGGDPRSTATGASQGNSAYRRMTVFDGDNYWGERCELAKNDQEGPVAFYHEGRRRVTYASFRLPSNFPTTSNKWQGVLQMKQAAPANNQAGTPVISLSAFRGEWSLWHSDAGYTDEDFELWATPATNGIWTRVAIDAFYSADPNRGWIKVYIDRNGDGDFSDSGEQSPTFHTNTLKREIGSDTSDGLAAGDSIPSHLRVGMYHHADIPCPSSSGCSVEADNIQVVKG
jgi:hypothetical protein